MLSQQITFSISPLLLIVLGLLVVLLIGIIVFLVIRQRRLQRSLQPKYGFLGKSLYAALTIILFGGGLIFGLLAINQQAIFQVDAKKTMTADIVINELSKDTGSTYVSMRLVPTVEGKVWGKSSDRFTIYWTLTGANGVSYTFLEENRSNEERSSIQTSLEDGSYTVTVNVIFENNTYTFTKEATF